MAIIELEKVPLDIRNMVVEASDYSVEEWQEIISSWDNGMRNAVVLMLHMMPDAERRQAILDPTHKLAGLQTIARETGSCLEAIFYLESPVLERIVEACKRQEEHDTRESASSLKH